MTLSQKHLLIWSGIVVGVVLALWLLSPVLMPFIVAAVLAYALTPLVDKLHRLWRGRVSRLVVVMLVEFLFLIALLAITLLIIPVLYRELPLISAQLPLLVDKFNDWLQPWAARWDLNISLDISTFKALLVKFVHTSMQDSTGAILASLRTGSSVALVIIGNLLLIPIALLYFLLDWHRLVQRVFELVPLFMRDSVERFAIEVDAVLGQYLRGQLLVMFIMAVFFAAGLALFGLDMAVPIGVFTGLAMFIPYVGFAIGLTLAILAGLLQFASSHALVMVAVVYGLGQVLESFIITPRLVGQRIGLHPLMVIFALLAFGQLFGFVGVLVALPTSAVLLVAIRRLRHRYLTSALYLRQL